MAAMVTDDNGNDDSCLANSKKLAIALAQDQRSTSAILKLFGSCCRGWRTLILNEPSSLLLLFENATLYFAEEGNPLLDRYPLHTTNDEELFNPKVPNIHLWSRRTLSQ
jgi:hypothetical protein